MIIGTAPWLWYNGLMKNSGQFKKGATPWNTGTRGIMKPNKTSFKKGHGYIPLEQRFWANVEKSETCWLWTASLNSTGYGRININGVIRLAHRVSYELSFGPIPNGKHILHKCDTPRCVRPEHLFAGTHKENMLDMHVKGRACIGEDRSQSKLTWMSVDRIRSLYATGTWTQRELAKVFNISQPLLCQVVNKRIW